MVRFLAGAAACFLLAIAVRTGTCGWKARDCGCFGSLRAMS